jgi:lipid-A-disaccharide synthase
MIIKIPYISLVNILSKKEIVKEFIQKDANASAIAKEVCSVIGNEKKYNAMRESLLKIRKDLGEAGVAKRAAEMIVSEVFPK